MFHDINEMENEVLKIINEIKAKSPKAISIAKKAINIAYERPLSEGLKIERKLLTKVLKTEEAKQLMVSFIKRSKQFKKDYNFYNSYYIFLYYVLYLS